MPKTPDELMQFLESLGITVTTYTHPPVFSVSESHGISAQIPGAHTKNLFLRDRKDRHFLVVVEQDAVVDLKQLHHVIGASGRLSFGKPEKMMELLGVIPGSVTVFGLINDTNHEVTVILDSHLMESDIITGHPLHNAATTTIQRDDLLRFIRATGHEPMILKVSQ
ncbi:prolyl-tRNA synthetase associated domain-containing protein [Chelativorans composti]|uniref:Prolyl-tRNA synthetase associated domain-containing protein n=1 Tax=Chelativorans composti TaxID=768533 RepID=A0ABW5DEU0_9HYPH